MPKIVSRRAATTSTLIADFTITSRSVGLDASTLPANNTTSSLTAFPQAIREVCVLTGGGSRMEDAGCHDSRRSFHDETVVSCDAVDAVGRTARRLRSGPRLQASCCGRARDLPRSADRGRYVPRRSALVGPVQ